MSNELRSWGGGFRDCHSRNDPMTIGHTAPGSCCCIAAGRKSMKNLERNFSRRGKGLVQRAVMSFISNPGTPRLHFNPSLSSGSQPPWLLRKQLCKLSRSSSHLNHVGFLFRKLDNHCCLKKAPVAQRLLWILALGRIKRIWF